MRDVIIRFYRAKPRLTVTVSFILACGFAVSLNAPELIPGIAIPCVSWYAWRLYRVSAVGAILAAISLELITGIASLVYHSHGSVFDFMWFAILIFPALGCMLAGVIAFLVRAYRVPAERRQNLFAAVAACLVPITWFAVGPRSAGMLNEWALQREIVQTGLPELAVELTAAAERLGRAPKNEEEVARLLGKPLPCLSRGKVSYHAGEGRHFTLGFGYDLDRFTFNSKTPERGWHRLSHTAKR